MPPSSSDSSQSLHPLLDALTARIRQCRALLPELNPMQIDEDLEAITGSLEGEALFIRNELHQCRGVRKLHFEIARLGLGLQILHCVFFPDPRFDLPIFGADIVAGPAGISAAIVDLSPVEATLQPQIIAGLQQLSLPSFAQERDLPAWGTIFSPFVRFIRPAGDQEEASFVDLVEAYLGVFTAAVLSATPDPADAVSTINRYKGQLSYCQQQKRNDKTRRVLAKAFNPQWADRYIEKLLFDDPPMP
ncbi:MAG: phycocyanobilin:ferredoxin oxidoreductase [Prochlorococcus sp.]|nr:phycocyanobilin:ferredoxin oxidoreductase [Prochlorococcaceae cyanobacterium Fu_MAG_50]